MAVLGIGRTAIWRTRSAYHEGGVEAQILALASSEPPMGAKRWTLESLAQSAQAQSDIGPISRETIRRLLKKAASNPDLD